ncbi:DNA (cytosine-5-)-methyltransferase [Ruminococcus sp.]|uniref:DNA (cytosine-5-)-methyltransferase n=1 Tax=Ruminococcus sp. TaxID=41978 RepID=UPI00344C75DC
MSIKFLDMFAGIGGFRSRLEAIGGFECVGYCEIDKYAKQAYEAMYDTGGELYFDDARKIVPEQLPDFDLLLGGFPCQSFSIAGARKGFDDIRETLFFKIARIAAVKNLSISSSKMFPVCLTMTQAKHLKQSSVRGPRKAISFLGRGGTA